MFEMSELERAIGRFRGQPHGNGDVASRISAAAFRAMLLERLRAVEGDVAELKNRVNGLIFVVIGAVIVQIVMRVAA
jgi:hypothetical protein